MAGTCTQLAGLNSGRTDDVARGIGGTLVSPPLNVSDVKRYFGDVTHFSQVVDLFRVVQHGVPPRNQTFTSRLQEGARVREPQHYTETSAADMENISGRCKEEQVPGFKK